MSGPTMTLEKCQDLFEHPSVHLLRKSEAFVSFVEYTLRRAGYAVRPAPQNMHATFEVYADGRVSGQPDAYVLVRKVAENYNIGIGDVQRLQADLHNGAAGFIITQSGFTSEAVSRAQVQPRVHLLDCRQLRRYVDYVRGTREEKSTAPAISLDAVMLADGITRRDRGTTKILTIANNKGGEGKTTTALYLAKLLGERGKQVLLVDLDAQANLTDSLPNDTGGPADGPSLVDYFQQTKPLHAVIRPTQLANVWLVPSNKRLRLALTGVATQANLEVRFVEALHDASLRPDRGDFDWMILDTPPDMTLLQSRAALAAAHWVLAPTSPGPYAESGLQQLLDTISAVRGLVGQDVRMMGCVVTKWQGSNEHKDAVNQLKQVWLSPRGIFVLASTIRFDPNIAKEERGRFRLPGLKNKSGAVDYGRLVEEVIAYDDNA